MLVNNLQSQTTGPWTFNLEVLHENTFQVIGQMQINAHILILMIIPKIFLLNKY